MPLVLHVMAQTEHIGSMLGVEGTYISIRGGCVNQIFNVEDVTLFIAYLYGDSIVEGMGEYSKMFLI